MLTKISQLFVIHQKTTSFSYIRQAYDPCLRHGDELRSLHSCSTGSPACQGLRPRTPGWKIIAALFRPVPVFPPMLIFIPYPCSLNIAFDLPNAQGCKLARGSAPRPLAV